MFPSFSVKTQLMFTGSCYTSSNHLSKMLNLQTIIMVTQPSEAFFFFLGSYATSLNNTRVQRELRMKEGWMEIAKRVLIQIQLS